MFQMFNHGSRGALLLVVAMIQEPTRSSLHRSFADCASRAGAGRLMGIALFFAGVPVERAFPASSSSSAASFRWPWVRPRYQF